VLSYGHVVPPGSISKDTRTPSGHSELWAVAAWIGQSASGQSTPFSAATVVSSGSVFAMAGLDTAAASNEIATVGQLQISGIGAHAGTVRWDSNDAGVIVEPAFFASQAVVFDPSTGRGMGVFNRAMTGTVSAQAGGPYRQWLIWRGWESCGRGAGR
jgi:hypothetical protein